MTRRPTTSFRFNQVKLHQKENLLTTCWMEADDDDNVVNDDKEHTWPPAGWRLMAKTIPVSSLSSDTISPPLNIALCQRDLFEREPWVCADSPHSKLAHLGWVWSTLRWRVIKESSWILEKMIETLLQEAAWCQGSSQDRKQKSCLPCFSQIMICFTFCKKKSFVHV